MITSQPTPNPNALKFTVGVDVGGPKTYVATGDVDDDTARQLLDLDGVTSMFMTTDFVTISKTPDSEWATIEPAAMRILSERFGG
jgi:hypothetical protein